MVRVVGSIDYALLFVVAILVLIGVVMVFSASYMTAAARHGSPFHFLRPSITFAVIGFVVMVAVCHVNYEFIRPLSLAIYGAAVALLIMVIFFGEEIGGARRWINLPIIGQFQPSELARAAVIFLLAYLVEKFPGLSRSFRGLLFLSASVVIVVGLIAWPGGFSVAIITTVIGFGLIAVTSPYFWHLVVLGGVGAAGVGGYLWWESVAGEGFRGGRFAVWLDPFSDPLGIGFQIINGLYAIASGGWFGLGIGNSRQATFIPEPQNDMIFAIIVEELGFFGAVVIIILYAVFIWRGIIISMRAPDTFGAITALGIVFAIGIPALVNIAVVTNSIPNTGVNLPFISYGGTSLIVSMGLAGVLLSISRYSTKRSE